MLKVTYVFNEKHIDECHIELQMMNFCGKKLIKVKIKVLLCLYAIQMNCHVYSMYSLIKVCTQLQDFSYVVLLQIQHMSS